MKNALAIKDKFEVSLNTFESKLLEYPQDFEAPVYHRFGPGVYIRELHIPAGVTGMGHKQRFSQVNNFVSGKINLMNGDGTAIEMVAPKTFVGPPGRKVVQVIEDMIWQNIYPTEETDIEKLEAMFLDKSEESLVYYASKVSLGFIKKAQEDFCYALKEFNLTEEYVQSESVRENDLMAMPYEYCSSCVRTSPINGKGYFASAPFKQGAVIAPAVLGGKRTPASRYMNHSHKPNATVDIKHNGDIYFIALSNISGCRSGDNGEEITTDYRDSMRYRQRGELCLVG